MLHEHTDHGLLRCRDHLKPVQRVLGSTSQPRTPVCSAPLQRPLNGSWGAFPNNDQHARLGPCSAEDQFAAGSAITNLLQPSEDANSVSPTSSGREGKWRSQPHPRVATFYSPRRPGLCLWTSCGLCPATRCAMVVRRCDGSNFGCHQERRKRAYSQATSLPHGCQLRSSRVK